MQSKLAAEARRPANDHAADVVAPDVSRHDAIGDQEGRGPRVVGDHPVGGEIGIALLVAVSSHGLHGLDDREEQVRAVVRIFVLQHRYDALKAHAGVDMFGWQRLQ